MYFNEKGNTNIDDQFKDDIGLRNPKTLLFIIGGILLLAIIIAIIVIYINNANKPKIQLLGDDTITIAVGREYIDPGYKAYDKDGNDITNKVEVTNNVDTSTIGEYEILYSVEKTTAVRNIIVVETVDETFIKLNGNINMNLQVGEEYIEPGYEVYDSIDKDLTDKVTVSGSVDTSKVGTYQITYSVVNSRNITTTVKRTIIVRGTNSK